MTTASKAAAFTFSETTLNTVGNGSTFPVYRATHNIGSAVIGGFKQLYYIIGRWKGNIAIKILRR